MKPNKKLNLSMLFAILMSAIFCLACFGIIDQNSKVVIAEQTTQAVVEENVTEVKELSDLEKLEMLENTSGNWIDNISEPGGSVDSLGSIEGETGKEHIKISTPNELAWLTVNMSSYENFKGRTIELIADMNLGGRFWTPIAHGSSFEGTFLGNGHLITGMTFESSDWGSLFGCLGGNATVSDFIIKNCVNAKYALAAPDKNGDGRNSSSKISAVYSENLPLFDGETTGVYHSYANGTEFDLISGWEMSDGTIRGLNSYDYEVKYFKQDGTSVQSIGASQTITKIEIYHYSGEFDASGSHLGDYHGPYTSKTFSGDALTNSYSSGITVKSNSGKATRGYSISDSAEVTINYAHQTAVYIKVYVGTRQIKINGLTTYRLEYGTERYTYDELKKYYEDPDFIPNHHIHNNYAPFEIVDSNGTVIFKTEEDGTTKYSNVTVNADKTIYIRPAESLNIDGFAICDFGLDGNDDSNPYGTWITESISEGKKYDLSKYTGRSITIDVRVRNLYSVTLKNNLMSFNTTDKILQVSTSTSGIAYVCSNPTGGTGGIYLSSFGPQTSLREDYKVSSYLSSVYLTTSESEGVSTGGSTNNHIFDNDTKIDGNKVQIASSDIKYVKMGAWTPSNKELYCAWLLKNGSFGVQITEKYKDSITAELYKVNPYSGEATLLYNENTVQTGYSIPYTFRVVVINSNEAKVSDKVLGVKYNYLRNDYRLGEGTVGLLWQNDDVINVIGNAGTKFEYYNYKYTQGFEAFISASLEDSAKYPILSLIDKTVRVGLMAKVDGRFSDLKNVIEISGTKFGNVNISQDASNVSGYTYYKTASTYNIANGLNFEFSYKSDLNLLYALSGMSICSEDDGIDDDIDDGIDDGIINYGMTLTYEGSKSPYTITFGYGGSGYAFVTDENGNYIAPEIILILEFNKYENKFKLNFYDDVQTQERSSYTISGEGFSEYNGPTLSGGSVSWNEQEIIKNIFFKYYPGNSSGNRIEVRFEYDYTWWQDSLTVSTIINGEVVNFNPSLSKIDTSYARVTLTRYEMTYNGSGTSVESNYDINIFLTRRTHSAKYNMVYKNLSDKEDGRQANASTISITKFDQIALTNNVDSNNNNYGSVTIKKKVMYVSGNSLVAIDANGTELTTVNPIGKSGKFSYYIGVNASNDAYGYSVVASGLDVNFKPKLRTGMTFSVIAYNTESKKYITSNGAEQTTSIAYSTVGFTGALTNGRSLNYPKIKFYTFADPDNNLGIVGTENYYQMVQLLVSKNIYTTTPQITVNYRPAVYTFQYYNVYTLMSGMSEQKKFAGSEDTSTVQSYLKEDDRVLKFMSGDLPTIYSMGKYAVIFKSKSESGNTFDNENICVHLTHTTGEYNTTYKSLADYEKYWYSDSVINIHRMSGVEENLTLKIYQGNTRTTELGSIDIKYTEIVDYIDDYYSQRYNWASALYNACGNNIATLFANNQFITEFYASNLSADEVTLAKLKTNYIANTAPLARDYVGYNWDPTGDITGYDIFTKLDYSNLDITFEGSYLNPVGNVSKTIKANVTEIAKDDVPVPARAGYTFAYWKAEKDGVSYYLKLSADKSKYVCTTTADGTTAQTINTTGLTFYSYWNMNTISIKAPTTTSYVYNGYSRTFNFTFEDSEGALPSEISSQLKTIVVAKKGTTDIWKDGAVIGNTNIFYGAGTYGDNKFGINLLYYDHSGNYEITLNPANIDWTKMAGANSKQYVINADSITPATITQELKIDKKQLYFTLDGNNLADSEKIEKIYDGTVDVLSKYGVGGICAIDANSYKITSIKYTQSEVGDNIKVYCTVDYSGTLRYNSYTLPDGTGKGNIAKYQIHSAIRIGASDYYNGQEYVLLDCEIINGVKVENYIRDQEIEYDYSNSLGILEKHFENIPNLTPYKDARLIIKTNSAEVGTYSMANGNLIAQIIVYDENGEDKPSSNFEVIVEEEFSIIDLADNETLWRVTAQRENNEDVSSIISSITAGGSSGTDYTYAITFDAITIQFIRTKKMSSKPLKLNIKFKNANWWINEALYTNIKDENQKEVVDTGLITVQTNNSIATANIPVPSFSATYYDVVLNVTQEGNVKFNLGLLKNEVDVTETDNVIDQSERKYKYGQTYKLPTPIRYRLDFAGWAYIDDSGVEYTIESGKDINWSIKGDIELYAKWNYVATIEVTGNDVNSVYSPDLTYSFTATPSISTGDGTPNAVLDNLVSQEWHLDGKSINASKKNGVSNNSISAHNVLESGKYTYTYSISLSNNKYDNDKDIITTSITINYIGTSANTNKYINVNISKKNVVLTNISKIFDGVNSLDGYSLTNINLTNTIYTNTDTNTKAINEILTASSVNISFSDIWVGTNKALTITSTHQNYSFSGNGGITKRNVTFVIDKDGSTTATFGYTGSVASVSGTEVKIDNSTPLGNYLQIESRKIKTNSANIGTYNGISNILPKYLIPSSVGYYGTSKTQMTDEQFKNSFKISVTGTIVIRSVDLNSDYEIIVGFVTAEGTNNVYDPNNKIDDAVITETTYNLQVQNILILLKNKNNGAYTTLTSNETNGYTLVNSGDNYVTNLSFNDAGTYYLSIKINIPNYAEYSISKVDITVHKLDVVADITKAVKTYDGNTSINPTYSLKFLNKNGTIGEVVDSKYVTELNNKYSFSFEDKDANKNIGIILNKSEDSVWNNYTIVLGSVKKGEINKRTLNLTILDKDSIDTRYFNNTPFILSALETSKTGLVSGEDLTGSITLSTVVNAGTYTVNDNKINEIPISLDGFNITGTNTKIANYDIKLNGSVTIRKAVIVIELTQDRYEYSGTTHTINYTATTNPSVVGADMTKVVSISENNGVEVIESKYHDVKFVINDDYKTNYTFTDLEDDYDSISLIEIYKKVVELKFETDDYPLNEQAYNAKKFRYNFENNARFVSLLVSGHSFNSSSHTSYAETNGTLVGLYKGATRLTTVIKVFDGNGNDKTHNYDIKTENTELYIVVGSISGHSLTTEFEYNGYIRNPSATITIGGENVNFTINGESDDDEFRFNEDWTTYTGSGDAPIVLTVRTVRENQVSDFKYAGNYSFIISGQVYTDSGYINLLKQSYRISGITITPKEIKSVNNEIFDKEYDGTDTFTYILNSDDIVSNNHSHDNGKSGVCTGDSEHIKLMGEYSSIYGTNLPITLSFANEQNGMDILEFELLQGSYKIAYSPSGTISERKITLTYSGEELYYDGNYKVINISDFTLSNTTEGNNSIIEDINGELTFNSIINAKTYTLDKNTNVTYNLTFGNSGSKLGYYIFTLAGQIIVNKAQISVSNVENFQYTYDGVQKEVTVYASGLAGRGAIAESDLDKDGRGINLISVTYKLDGQGEDVSPINAGTYFIYPTIKSDKSSNYELVYGLLYTDVGYISTKLIINKRELIVSSNATNSNLGQSEFSFITSGTPNASQILIQGKPNGSEFDELNLVSGHNIAGIASIELNNGLLETGLYKYITYNTNDIKKLTVSGVKITRGAEDVTSNYDIKYYILITITDGAVEGQINFTVEDSQYIYNAQNQIGTIAVIFQTKQGEEIKSASLTAINSSNEYGQIIGFYKTFEEAKAGGTSETSIINARINENKYYVSVKIKTAVGASDFIQEAGKDKIFVTSFNIHQKTIQSYTLFSDKETSFDFIKIYDGTDSIKLSSGEIYNADKESVYVIAKYTGVNSGDYSSISLTLTDENGNYKLATATKSGKIIARNVYVETFSDDTTQIIRSYIGITVVEIKANDLKVRNADTNTGLISGHSLSGSVYVTVNENGDYYLKDVEAHTLTASPDTIKNNYNIVISENLKIIVTQAIINVTISWNGGVSYYTGIDQKSNVKVTYANISDFKTDAQNLIQTSTVLTFKKSGIEVNELINAGTYEVLIASTNENFTFIVTSLSEVEIQRAEITVDKVSGSEHDYDGTGKTAVVTAKVVNGAFDTTSNKNNMFAVTYKKELAGSEVTPINVGEYYIYPSIVEGFASNYKLVPVGTGAEYQAEGYTNTRLKINKRDLTITANQKFVNVGRTEFVFTTDANIKTSLYVTLTGLVLDHTLVSGKVDILSAEVGKYYYITGGTQTATLTDAVIKDAETTANYNIIYNIIIEITNVAGVGEIVFEVLKITYTSDNLIEDITVKFTKDESYEEVTINTVYSSGDLGTIIGFYESEENAKQGASLSEIIDAGTYYVAVKTDNGVGSLNNEILTIPFEVSKKVIAINTLLLNSNAFDGFKIYDGETTHTLSSTDIYGKDKSIVSIKATYTTANAEVYGTKVNLVLEGSGIGNYELETAQIDGIISKKDVTITAYNGGADAEYIGTTTVEVTAGMLTHTEIVSGHSLGGQIKIAVTKVGEYSIADKNNTDELIITDGKTNLTDNYNITIDTSLMLTISKATVIVTWRGWNEYYTGQDKKSVITAESFEYSYPEKFLDDAKAEAKSAIKLTFNGNANEEVKNAGDYTLGVSGNENIDIILNAETKITVKKAQVTVSDVANTLQTYGADIKVVTITAKAVNGGIIGDPKAIINAQYTLENTTDKIDAINVGTYTIYPGIMVDKLNNYELVSGDKFVSGKDYLTDVLVIEKKALTISANGVYSNVGQTVFEFTLNANEVTKLLITQDGIVEGHETKGSVSIEKGVKNNKYLTGANDNNITLNQIKIFDQDDIEVTGNYQIEYDLVITIINGVVEGQISFEIDNITYNTENYYDIIKVRFVTMKNGVTDTKPAYKDNWENEYGKVLGFYTDDSYAQEGLEAGRTTELVNAKTYYVALQRKNSNGDILSDILVASFEILQKEIKDKTFTLNDIAFDGTKVYDAETVHTLSSTDIYSSDKDKVKIKATYQTPNVGKTTITLELLGNAIDINNYKLVDEEIEGNISKRTLTITQFKDLPNLENDGKVAKQTYLGLTSRDISSVNLVYENNVTGHSLNGTITLTLGNVGDYYLSKGSKSLTITAGGNDVSENYDIQIQDDVVLKLTIATVEVKVNDWSNQSDSIYSSMDKYNLIRDRITFVYPEGFIAETEAENSLMLSYTYLSNLVNATTVETVEVKQAGEYTLLLNSNSLNIQYVFSADTLDDNQSQAGTQIVVEKKEAQINLGVTEILYITYRSYLHDNENGFNLKYLMATSVFESDKVSFESMTYKISVAYIARETYLSENGQIQVNFVDYITNNYTFTEILGGFNLLAEDIEIDKIADLIYNGEDQLPNLIFVAEQYSVTYADREENGNYIQTIKYQRVESDDPIVIGQIKNAGIYTVTIIINTSEYKTTVIVNKKAVTLNSFNIKLTENKVNKVYDGTDDVISTDNLTTLVSTGVNGICESDKDSVTITAKYQPVVGDNLKSWFVGTHEVVFTMEADDVTQNNYILPQNVEGNIVKKEITLTLGNFELVYSKTNEYSYILEDSNIAGVVSDTITGKEVLFKLTDNNVKYNLGVPVARMITTRNMAEANEFNLNGLVITNGQDISTDCYDITVQGNLTLRPIEFTFEYTQFDSDDDASNGIDDKLIYNASQREVEVNINIILGNASEDELALILANLKDNMLYSKEINFVFETIGEELVKEIGSYKAVTSYSSIANYVTSTTGDYQFEIIPYEYILENESVILKITKEYAKEDPLLEQLFKKEFENGECFFNITFTRELGETLGNYDLLTPICDNDNIKFTVQETSLADKFEIVKNTSTLVKLEITHGVSRYYGLDDIEKVSLSELEYNIYLDNVLIESVSVLSELVLGGYNTPELAGLDISSFVVYNVLKEIPDVGSYDVKNDATNLYSTNFTNFIVINTISDIEGEVDGRLAILQRSVSVAYDNYDKVYDGDEVFYGNISAIEIEEGTQGTLSQARKTVLMNMFGGDGNLAGFVNVIYDSADAGSRNLLLRVLGDNEKNINAQLVQNVGVIEKLYVDVDMGDNQELTYGNISNTSRPEYTVTTSIKYSDSLYLGNVPNKEFTAETLNAFVNVTIENADYSTSGYLKANDIPYNIVANVNALFENNIEINFATSTTLTISKKELIITFDKVVQKEQDGTSDINLNEYIITIDGICKIGATEDYVSVLNAKFVDELPATDKIIKFTLQGADSSNYFARDSRGNIIGKNIIFKFNYYGFESCNEFINSEEDLLKETITIKELYFNYFASIDASKNKLPIPAYKNDGVKCIGWSTKPNGQPIDTSAVIKDYIHTFPADGIQDLYAVWETQKFYVTIMTYKYDVTQKPMIYVSANDVSVEKDYGIVISISELIQTYVVDAGVDITNFKLYGYGINTLLEEDLLSVDGATYKVIDENVVINILYKPVMYKLKFNTDGGYFAQYHQGLEYMENVASVDIYYGQTIGSAISDIRYYLDVLKTGYTPLGWQLVKDGTIKTIYEIENYQINDNVEFIAKWKANEYKLILNASGGHYEAYDNEIWYQYASNASGMITAIYTIVTYDKPIPTYLPQSNKKAYIFDGYVNQLNESCDQMVGTTWNKTSDEEIFAIYSDKDFTITINTENATISSINVWTEDGNPVTNITNQSQEQNVYIYNVKTSYKVTIQATANQGYKNPIFVDENNLGTQTEHSYTINDFTKDVNAIIRVVTDKNINKIKLTTNSDDQGYITSTFAGSVYASNGSNIILALTESEVAVLAIAKEGYEFDRWEYVQNGQGTGILEGNGSSAILKGFTSDGTIHAYFKPIELSISVTNDPELGKYLYKDQEYTGGIHTGIFTGEEFTIYVYPTNGYELDINNVKFTRADSEDATKLLTIEKDGDRFKVTLSGFTSSGTINLVYSIKKYTINFFYAEYDDVTNKISSKQVEGLILSVNEINVNYGESKAYEHGTSLTLTALYQKTGYKLYKFVYQDNLGEFVELTGVLDMDRNNLQFVLTNELSIFVVYEKSTYEIKFVTNNTVNGKIGLNTLNDGDFVQLEEHTQLIRFNSDIKPMKAVIADEYRVFKGWYVNNTKISENEILEADISISNNLWKVGGVETDLIITENLVITAVFEGTTQVLKVVIYGENGRDLYTDIEDYAQEKDIDIKEVFTEINGFTVSEVKNDEVSNTVIASIIYTVGENIAFDLNLPSWYQLNTNNVISELNRFNVGIITPAIYNDLKPYEIKLAIRYYMVNLLVEEGFENAVSFDLRGSECIGVDITNSDFNKSSTIMAVAYVKYGGTLVAQMEVTSGYTYSGLNAENAIVKVQNGKVTISDINSEKSIVFKFGRTKYKVIFNTNYPTKYPIGDYNYEANETNFEFTFYTGHGEKELLDENKNKADLTNLKLAEDYTTSEAYKKNQSIIFAFRGWGIDGSPFNRYYNIDENGIYYITNDTKLYGLETVIPETDKDGNIILDEHGNAIVYLYAIWYIPTSKINVRLVPNTLEANETDIEFANVIGILEKEEGATDHLITAAYGTNILMVNIPQFDGYKFYGWKFEGEVEIPESQINSGVNFKMPNYDVTIVMYYSFKVTIEVVEPIGNTNIVKVNNEQIVDQIMELWCLENQIINLEAIASNGYEWGYWAQGKVDAKVDTMAQICNVQVADSTTFYAVFIGKKVTLVLNANSHVNITLEKSTATVGETINILIGDVEYGYVFNDVTVNGSVNDVEQNPSGSIYYYTIKPSDAQGDAIVIIEGVTNAEEVIITIASTETEGYIIKINNEDVTNFEEVKYRYNDNLSISIETKLRYQLLSIALNGNNLETQNVFDLHLFNQTPNQEGGIIFAKHGKNNLVININKLYWIDAYEKFGGNGSEESPYLIGDGETLAYLAYIVNNGIIDQTIKRIYYKVTANIDLSSRFWEPIGTEKNPFNGTFILGEYSITGVYHAKEYTHLSWDEYCWGVFGYITANAQIILKQSFVPTIILIIGVLLFIIIVITGIILIVSNRNKKVKKLSQKLGVSEMQVKDKVDLGEIYKENGIPDSVDDINLNIDDEVKKILSEKNKSPKKPPKKPTSKDFKVRKKPPKIK